VSAVNEIDRERQGVWRQREAGRMARVQRLADFVFAALESGREVRPEWRGAVEDAANDLVELIERVSHPDDRDKAASAIGSLAKMWLTTDECDAVYLGGEEP
jgi:hypothetical protein